MGGPNVSPVILDAAGVDAGDYVYVYDANSNVGQVVAWASGFGLSPVMLTRLSHEGDDWTVLPWFGWPVEVEALRRIKMMDT